MSESLHWTWLLEQRGLSYERWLLWHCYALLPLQPERAPSTITARQAPLPS